MSDPTIMFMFACAFQSWDEKLLLGKIITTFAEMNSAAEWGLEIAMPASIESKLVKFRDEKRPFFKNQEQYQYYMVFDHAITEYEVNMWRMFMVGKFAFQRNR